MGVDHPVSWCKDFQGGRSFYTALGNTARRASTSRRSGPTSAARSAGRPGGRTRSTATAAPRCSPTTSRRRSAAPPNVASRSASTCCPTAGSSRPTAWAVSGCTTRRPTRRRSWPTIPVYMHSEDGMYGPAIDDDFASNSWVYLYYAPPTVEDVKLSDGCDRHPDDADRRRTQHRPRPRQRGTRRSGTSSCRGSSSSTRPDDTAHLDLASEQQILRVPVNRGACCHVAGDIDFDTHGNLWLVTGDDTPAGGGDSGGFGPFNDQLTATGLFNAPHVDARRSALNTNDLRGKVLRIAVEERTSRRRRRTRSAAPTPCQPGTCSRPAAAKTRPEIYAMGFRNPFRIQVDEQRRRLHRRLLARLADAAGLPWPGRHRADHGRSRAGELRLAALLPHRPALLPWNFVTSQPLDDPPQRCTNATTRDRGHRTTRGGTSRAARRSSPALEHDAADDRPRRLVLVRRQQRHPALGTPCFAVLRRHAAGTSSGCARSCSPRSDRRRRRAARAARLRVRPGTARTRPAAALLRRRPVLRRVHPRLPAGDPPRLAGPGVQDQQRCSTAAACAARRRRSGPVRVRQPDGRPVRRGRPLLPAHLRRRVLPGQRRRRHATGGTTSRASGPRSPSCRPRRRSGRPR